MMTDDDAKYMYGKLGSIESSISGIQKELTLSNEREAKIREAMWKKLDRLENIDTETNRKLDGHISKYEADINMVNLKIKIMAIVLAVTLFSAGIFSSDFIKRAFIGLF